MTWKFKAGIRNKSFQIHAEVIGKALWGVVCRNREVEEEFFKNGKGEAFTEDKPTTILFVLPSILLLGIFSLE